ncbi:hypothetical protein ATANTOWER_002890 [Ataeniobius toweri]|uniref:Uncharacterized protein n=1 Tax=Ataeniobius toweri TaxID=208326 RepID=A0ABU7BEB9_9TELE|nr:hypothetical protein [Ataeniobius toweri]
MMRWTEEARQTSLVETFGAAGRQALSRFLPSPSAVWKSSDLPLLKPACLDFHCLRPSRALPRIVSRLSIWLVDFVPVVCLSPEPQDLPLSIPPTLPGWIPAPCGPSIPDLPV